MDRRCCCVAGCEVYIDDFNRADSADIGSVLTEVSGAWEIKNNELQATAIGIVRTIASHPKDDPTCHASVDWKDMQFGDCFRVLVDYVDEDNYLFGSFALLDANNGTLSVGEVADGVETILDTLTVTPGTDGETPPSYDDGLYVCRSVDGIHANLKSDYPAAWKCDIADNGGRKAGLEVVTLAASVACFDNFYWAEHYATNPDCLPCNCDCEEQCVPKRMELTFVDIDPCTCSFAGISDISDVIDNASLKIFEFYLDLPTDPITLNCTLAGPVMFSLTCPAAVPNKCDEWILECFTWCSDVGHTPSACGWGGGGVWTANTAKSCDCTCDPMIWKFGPFLINTEDGLCSYEIHITPVYT